MEDLTTVTSSELLDVEDEVSTPVTTAANNGNSDSNPVRETTAFISGQINGVIQYNYCMFQCDLSNKLLDTGVGR